MIPNVLKRTFNDLFTLANSLWERVGRWAKNCRFSSGGADWYDLNLQTRQLGHSVRLFVSLPTSEFGEIILQIAPGQFLGRFRQTSILFSRISEAGWVLNTSDFL